MFSGGGLATKKKKRKKTLVSQNKIFATIRVLCLFLYSVMMNEGDKCKKEDDKNHLF